MIFVQKALAKQHEEKKLVELLDKRLSGWEKARPHTTLHASALTKDVEFCPREAVLQDIAKKPPKDMFIGTSLRVTYDQGRALHDMCRNDWLKDEIVGTWRCLACKHKVSFSKRPKLVCPVCKLYLWSYEEEHFVSQSSGVSGSLDALIDFGTGKHTITEIKTVDKDEFKTLKAPYGEHRVRTSLYLWIVKDSGRPEAEKIDLHRGKVLYISKAYGVKKEGGGYSPFKEYDVPYDEESVKGYVAKATKVFMFRQGKAGVPKGVCPNSFCGRAKQCSVIQECWSGKFPAQEA